MRKTISPARAAEKMRTVSNLGVSSVRHGFYPFELNTESQVLFQGLPIQCNEGVRTNLVAIKSGSEAANCIREKSHEAWERARQRVASTRFPARQLHLPGVRAEGREAQRRSHQAIRAIPRFAVRVIERANPLCGVSQKDSDLWLERLLAKASGLNEIAVQRLAQEVMNFGEVA